MRLCPSVAASDGPAAALRAVVCLLVIVTSTLADRKENGLDIEIISPGDCSLEAKNGDLVSMHYTGTLAGGTVFDSSYKRNSPLDFKLGEGLVIEGWDQGLLGMCLGEERRLIIPPDLAYGARKIGHIPPQSTLTFETKLLAINGVTKEQADASTAKPSDSDPVTDIEASEEPEDGGDSNNEGDDPDPDNAECRLLGPFALFVQAGLGVLALSSVVYKRWRERPRRPMKVWFFDVSKQVVGSALLHLLNVFMSMVSSEDYELASSPKNVLDKAARTPNPCSFYLINIAVDTTLGIPILVIFLKLLTLLAGLTPIARPPESIRTGYYGHPPRASWWAKQSSIYFICLLLMKLCVLAIFTFFPWVALAGEWALRWTEGSEALQIVFVMFIFPLIMNALQYYIIDSFIKDKTPDDGQASSEDDDDDHESREPLHRASEYEEGDLSPRDSEDAAAVKQGTIATTTRNVRDSEGSESEPLTDTGERKQ